MNRQVVIKMYMDILQDKHPNKVCCADSRGHAREYANTHSPARPPDRRTHACARAHARMCARTAYCAAPRCTVCTALHSSTHAHTRSNSSSCRRRGSTMYVPHAPLQSHRISHKYTGHNFIGHNYLTMHAPHEPLQWHAIRRF